MKTPDLRADFPVLSRTIDGMPIVYLDSAATSLRPKSVIAEVSRYNEEIGANVHRGRHILSQEASFAYEDARRTVARFVNADPDCIVFSKNATESINIVASGLRLESGARILVDKGSHHSNLLPWYRVGEVDFLPFEPMAPMDPIDIERLEQQIIATRPRVLAICHASNVTGVVHPLADICQIARRHGVLTVIDAAQSAPHLPIDVEALGVDFLAFSGHKMLAPTGVGILYGRHQLLRDLDPLTIGGGSVGRTTCEDFALAEPPQRFEAGTPNIAGIMGLAKAVEYLEAVGTEVLCDHSERLARVLAEELVDLPKCRVLQSHSKPGLAIASIAPSRRAHAGDDHGWNVDYVAQMLSDSHKIMVRSGRHCCGPFFESVNLPQGSVRISAYLYNREDELRACARALRTLLERL